jgi:Uma2 family endonuclease
MAMERQGTTAAEFDQFALLPENEQKILELIGGEIYEVPSNAYASQLSALFVYFLLAFVKPRNLGHVTTEAGGYMVAGERYAPDAAYISRTKQPELAREGYNPNPPDLVVEVDYPSTYESQRQLLIKISNYMAAGTVVWVARPDSKTVAVYIPGEPVKLLDIEDTLEGGDVLPGFILALKDVFED